MSFNVQVPWKEVEAKLFALNVVCKVLSLICFSIFSFLASYGPCFLLLFLHIFLGTHWLGTLRFFIIPETSLEDFELVVI